VVAAVSVRILLADDHPMFRAGLRGSLAADPELEVVAEAADGAEAIALALELRPDVVLMDLQMPGVNGVEATARLAEAVPQARVLVLTMFEDDHSVFAAMRAGARGYLLKGAGEEDVVRAVRTVADGGLVFGQAVAELVAAHFATGREQAPPVFPELTGREREILDLVARGTTNAAISQRLFLSQKTVRNHVSNIFNKLRVADRGEAIVRAREAGLGVDGPERG
jgi:DNA-binding NarL/FixJ family response regulator